METDPILTVIIPTFNNEGTIARALESIFSQRLDYPFNIIVVNDGSIDGTGDIVRHLLSEHDNLVLLDNESNLGNPVSVFRALSHTRSKYYAVLDGDDYYAHPYKLQCQLSFMEADVDEEYVAVVHKFITDTGAGYVDIGFPEVSEFTYEDFINDSLGTTSCGLKYHTSAFLYRNLYRGEPPTILTDDRLRGNVFRVFHLLHMSKKKVKVLDMFASVYCWSGQGIWSKLSAEKQSERMVGLYTALMDFAETDLERNVLESHAKEVRNLGNASGFNLLSIDDLVSRCNAMSSCAKVSDQSPGHISYSFECDSLAQVIGASYRTNNPMSTSVADDDAVMFIVSGFQKDVLKLLVERCSIEEMSVRYKVYVVSTGVVDDHDGVRDSLELLGIRTVACWREDRLSELFEVYGRISPFRAYQVCGHCDYYPSALLDDRSDNILVVPDRGCICGLSLAYPDRVMASHPEPYEMPRDVFLGTMSGHTDRCARPSCHTVLGLVKSPPSFGHPTPRSIGVGHIISCQWTDCR